ncbi:uncharacterized protein LOC123549258 [Mercenaria mercenaria]|uniref:uncharacterized protein LOC123549258 n=1 Tax=Mercenaria mercenaria TaxID=6596 RepID=UPI00234E985A|nr:uncharacterized protein LOC123549258 [Mercenaria mercenaria]
MVDWKLRFCFSLFILCYTKETTGTVESWDMQQQCGRTLESYGGTLHFDATMLRNSFCQVKIVGKGAADTMLSLFFTSFNVTGDSCMENVTIEEPGAVQQTYELGNIPNGLYQSFCRNTGYMNQNSIYTTFHESLILKYSSRQKEAAKNMKFTLKFSSFTSRFKGCTKEEAEEGMFSCPTGRCVHSSLLCGDLNPCGDNRDCNSTEAILEQNRDDKGVNYVKFLVVTIVVLFAIFALIQITLIVRNENKCTHTRKYQQKEQLQAELMPMTNGHVERGQRDTNVEVVKT